MVSNLLESSVTTFVIVAEIDSSASDSLMAVVIIDSVVVSSLVIDSINASACLETTVVVYSLIPANFAISASVISLSSRIFGSCLAASNR